MRPRRADENPLRGPVLIGALAVAVAIVAVVIAFQSTTGLPFVPRYHLNVQVRNAEELTHDDDVRMGGTLIGAVSSVKPGRDRHGQPIAVVGIALDKSVQPLPVDSRFTIRLKGAIGEKYLDVTLGHSNRDWRNGATVPVRQTGATVDLDRVLSMFTPPTRRGVARATTGFADALAGRGSDLNSAIKALRPLVGNLRPVTQNLASPKTNLAGFATGLESLAAAVKPVSARQADLFRQLDTTFRALAQSSPSLANLISQTPPTFRTVIHDSPNTRAFARDTAQLFAKLAPGVQAADRTAPAISGALGAGARNLPSTYALDRRLVALAAALGRFSDSPKDRLGVKRLTQTARSLTSPLAFLTPAQTVCNYPTLLLGNLASSLSDNVGSGTALRFVLIAIDDIAGGEAVPSQRPFVSTSTKGGTQHGPLHVNPFPYTAAPGQPFECAAGNEPYSPSQAVIGNPAGNVGHVTEQTGTTTGATGTTPGATRTTSTASAR